MADSKITALTSIGTSTDPANDPLVLVDVSDTSMAATGTTKKVTLNQLLATSPTATLASATITGDLTVDTSTLKVDSANNRVGIGTASPGVRVDILSDNNTSLAAVLRVNSNNAAVNTSLAYDGLIASGGMTLQSGANPFIINTNGANERYRIAADGVATWSNVGGVAGTAMTLNTTGLGVGVSPGVGFDLQQTSPMVRITGTSTTGYSSLTLRNTGASGRQYGITLGGSGTGTNAGNLVITDDTASATRFVLDSTGNVGIGVTPSAWGSVALQVGSYAGLTENSSLGSAELTYNCYRSSGSSWNYINSDTACRYRQWNSTHAWFIASSGTAGNPITFTQAMTLDASGRLILLASTTTPATLATNGELTFTATSNTNLRFSYRGSDGTTRVANITLA